MNDKEQDMTENQNPWLNQPDVDPYPTNESLAVVMLARALVAAYGEDADKDCPCEQDWDVARGLAPLLAEAERRGAERGWDEAVDELHGHGWTGYFETHETREANPYRPQSPSAATAEPTTAEHVHVWLALPKWGGTRSHYCADHTCTAIRPEEIHQ